MTFYISENIINKINNFTMIFFIKFIFFIEKKLFYQLRQQNSAFQKLHQQNIALRKINF